MSRGAPTPRIWSASRRRWSGRAPRSSASPPARSSPGASRGTTRSPRPTPRSTRCCASCCRGTARAGSPRRPEDDLIRLERRRVWVVDPLDGTREFVTGIPEWSVSVGLVVDGEPVAGGICNPATGETIVGARGLGVTLNGRPARVSGRAERSEGPGGGEPQRGQAGGVGGLPGGPLRDPAHGLGRLQAGPGGRRSRRTPPGRSPPSTSGTSRPASPSSSPPAA